MSSGFARPPNSTVPKVSMAGLDSNRLTSGQTQPQKRFPITAAPYQPSPKRVCLMPHLQPVASPRPGFTVVSPPRFTTTTATETKPSPQPATSGQPSQSQPASTQQPVSPMSPMSSGQLRQSPHFAAKPSQPRQTISQPSRSLPLVRPSQQPFYQPQQLQQSLKSSKPVQQQASTEAPATAKIDPTTEPVKEESPRNLYGWKRTQAQPAQDLYMAKFRQAIQNQQTAPQQTQTQSSTQAAQTQTSPTQAVKPFGTQSPKLTNPPQYLTQTPTGVQQLPTYKPLQQTQASPLQNKTTYGKKKDTYQPLTLKSNQPAAPIIMTQKPSASPSHTQSVADMDLFKQRLAEQQRLRTEEKQAAEEKLRQETTFSQKRLAEIYTQLEQERSNCNLDKVAFLDFQVSWLPNISDPDFAMDFGNTPAQNSMPGSCHLVREDSFVFSMHVSRIPEKLKEILETMGIYGK